MQIFPRFSVFIFRRNNNFDLLNWWERDYGKLGIKFTKLENLTNEVGKGSDYLISEIEYNSIDLFINNI